MAEPKLKKIIIVDDKRETRTAIKEAMNELGTYEFFEAEDGEEALEKIKNERPDLVFLDVVLPKINGVDILQEIKAHGKMCPVIMMTAYTNIRLAVLAMKLGAYNFIPKPFSKEQIKAVAQNAMEKDTLVRELSELRENLTSRYHFENITAKSGKMQDVLASINKVKESNINVLILGETGSGKELVAKAIHFNGPRRDHPLVTLNCASIPENLLESELFGYERGAFTGAYERKIGKFEMADKSSIFLDEIGELPLAAQAKVLRLIENKEFMRVGGSETIKADVRIISATHQDLIYKVKDKTFREDLYYRLSVFPIRIPPLRDRKEDLPYLISEFMEIYSKKSNKMVNKISPEAMDLFMHYHWPGNVRELENMIARAVILAPDDTITPDSFDSTSRVALEIGITPGQMPPPFSSEPLPLNEAERNIVLEALKDNLGDVGRAAKQLQISKSTLYRKIKEYRIGT